MVSRNDKMKCVAVGDIFITPEMMQAALEKFKDRYTNCKYFYFGTKKRSQMRDFVKIIEQGGGRTLELPYGLEQEIADADMLMVHLCPVTTELIACAKKLKVILCNRGGTENIDFNELADKDIRVLSNPAHNANAVAEYTVGLMLAETRNICRSHFALKNGEWREKYPNSSKIIEMKDLTIGIVGFGNVGELVCEKLAGFGCNILINDIVLPNRTNPKIDWEKVKFASLEEVIVSSDIVSLHARDPKKRILFSKREFESMKASAYFINTARSYMLDYEALYNALNEQKIRGAALDVFEIEPLGTEHPLLGMDNVTLTNHRGGDTFNAYADSPEMMLKEVERMFSGEKPKFLIC